jgi:hypothetical protein
LILRIVSLDIETTGLDPERDQILEFGAIIFDSTKNDVPLEDLQMFRRIVYRERIEGHPFAINMNSELIRAMSRVKPGALPDDMCLPDQIGHQFFVWLEGRGFVPEGRNRDGVIKIVAAGKNFGAFDMQFLKHLPSFNDYVQISHRSFDPAVLFFDPEKDDKLPALEQCLQRAGHSTSVTHQALGDAKAVIQCLRYVWTSNRSSPASL